MLVCPIFHALLVLRVSICHAYFFYMYCILDLFSFLVTQWKCNVFCCLAKSDESKDRVVFQAAGIHPS